MKLYSYLLLLLSVQAYGTDILSTWETAFSTKQVELQYRWLLVGDTLKTREMRAIFYVESSKEHLVTQIRSPQQVMKWAMRTKEFDILESTDSEWTSYTLFDIPKPFKQQDQVSTYKMTMHNDHVQIDLFPAPDRIEEVKNTERMKYYSGRWEIDQLDTKRTKVVFYSVSFTRPQMPRFIQDPILQRMICNSFEKLINISES